MAISVGKSMGETIKINRGDFLRSHYYIDHNQNQLLVVRSSDRVEVYGSTKTGPTLLGYITFGSPSSGAIWKSSDCVGEYLTDENDEYVITPIIDNRKGDPPVHGVDPFFYLLESLTKDT